MTGRRVLIAGVSTRALAESAARAGYRVLAVDGFADLDLSACADTVLRVRDPAGRFQPRLAARTARSLATPAVCYVASFENDPRAVRSLAADRALWGNSPAVLTRVRNPERLAQTLERRGFMAPQVRATRPTRASATRWLMKSRASGGGHGIVTWRPGAGARIPPGAYFQEQIAGMPGSIVFAADGHRAVALGLSRLLVGKRAFGAAGFRYCGNILADARHPQFAREAGLLAWGVALTASLTQAFGLVGVNGIDFIARAGRPYPLEVNPRYTASMELVERAYGLSMFDIHVRACAGDLPAFELFKARAVDHGAVGKAVVYARHDMVAGDTRAWLGDDTVRDIPAPGERIRRGHPICTVFARAPDAAACLRALETRAATVYRRLA